MAAALEGEGAVPPMRPARVVTAAEDAFELSARELEVARLVAGGLSNPAIASALFVSVATVKTHVSHILAKLGLDSRTQLASWVAGHDWTPTGFVDTIRSGPMVYEERTGSGTTTLIVAIHDAHKGRYGIDRIHADLARNGYQVSPKRVRRLARAAGLRCVHPRPYKATTVQDPANACGLVDLVGP